MTEDLVWSKWYQTWQPVKRKIENHIIKYYDFIGEVTPPEYLALLRLKPGMIWKYRSDILVAGSVMPGKPGMIKIISDPSDDSKLRHIYYHTDFRKESRGTPNEILYQKMFKIILSYTPLFNPEDFIGKYEIFKNKDIIQKRQSTFGNELDAAFISACNKAALTNI